MPRLSAEKQKDAVRRAQGGTIWNALRLRSGHFQRKMILNFGITERLRAFRYPIFTEGVVTANSICSAASCGSAALREDHLFSAGQKANTACLYDPSREKAIRENPRLRSNESPSGAFKRQSGLRKQMEGLCPNKLRRFSRIANYNKIPLKMPRAQAEGIPNRSLARISGKQKEPHPGSRVRFSVCGIRRSLPRSSCRPPASA